MPADIQTRTLTYSDADYAAMFAKALPAESQNVLKAYVAGLNAYIRHVRPPRPSCRRSHRSPVGRVWKAHSHATTTLAVHVVQNNWVAPRR